MNTIQTMIPAKTSLESNDRAVVEQYSQRNALRRVIRCIFAEKLIDKDQLFYAPTGNGAWLPLWDRKALLFFEDLKAAPANTFINNGNIRLIRQGQAAQEIETAGALLDLLHPLFCFQVGEEGLEKTKADIANSTTNDTQARTYRHHWNERLRKEIKAHGAKGLVDLMRQTQSTRKAAILLDQWGSLEGHPFYPTWKCKPNLTPDEVERLSPEFDAVVPVRITALRADMAYMERMPHVSDYHVWFAENFPDLYAAWKSGLESKDLVPAEYLPLPVHSWHLENFVKTEYAEEIADGILITDGPDLDTRPSMSFRTMLPETPDDAPFIKLPVAIWLTSELRGLQAKSINMGPRFSTVIERILYEEDGFNKALEFFPEDLGFHFKHAVKQDDHAGKHLSVVFRTTAKALNRNDGLLPVTVAALFAQSPSNARPLITELVEKGGERATADQVENFFRRYVQVVVKPVVNMYLLYGLTLEAHQQNTSILFDADGTPKSLLIRDYGDARAYSPLLEKRGHSIKPYRYGVILPTVFDGSIEPIRSFILDAVYVCHLHEMALMLSTEYGLASNRLWHIIGEETDAAFQAIAPRVHDRNFWEDERRIFLTQPWSTRSLLRMHLEQYADYRIQHELPNPITPAAE